MFADDIRRALPGTPRGRLAELAAAVWKGFACGAVSEGDAQQLAEEIAARKIIPPKPAEPRRRVGSRPRSPAEMERRRRWTSSGWLPPQLAARFTMAETAVLSTIAAEIARRGLCRLTIGHIASLAGVMRATGESVPDDLLTHTSPVGWEHIAFSGDFLWDQASAIPPGRRALNVGRGSRRAA